VIRKLMRLLFHSICRRLHIPCEGHVGAVLSVCNMTTLKWAFLKFQVWDFYWNVIHVSVFLKINLKQGALYTKTYMRHLDSTRS
jgi:hypothetical protein